MQEERYQTTSLPFKDEASSNGGLKYGHFARFNAFVDGGWLSKLKPIEKDVWIVYLRVSVEDGTAEISQSEVAKLIGHDTTDHVRKARRRLAAQKLIDRLDESTVIVLVPPAPAQVSVEAGQIGPASGRNGRAKVARARARSAHATGPDRPGDINQPIQLQRARAGPDRPGQISPPPDDIPPSLLTPDFLRAWTEWEQHRQEKRKKLTPRARELQLKRCAEYGAERSIKALTFAIEHNWESFCDSEGLYVEQRRQQRQQPKSAQTEQQRWEFDSRLSRGPVTTL